MPRRADGGWCDGRGCKSKDRGERLDGDTRVILEGTERQAQHAIDRSECTDQEHCALPTDYSDLLLTRGGDKRGAQDG